MNCNFSSLASLLLSILSCQMPRVKYFQTDAPKGLPLPSFEAKVCNLKKESKNQREEKDVFFAESENMFPFLENIFLNLSRFDKN